MMYYKSLNKQTASTITKRVCKTLGIEFRKVFGPCRASHVSQCRWIIWHLLHDHLGFTMIDIGRFFKKDHTSVSYGIKQYHLRFEPQQLVKKNFDSWMKEIPALDIPAVANGEMVPEPIVIVKYVVLHGLLCTPKAVNFKPIAHAPKELKIAWLMRNVDYSKHEIPASCKL